MYNNSEEQSDNPSQGMGIETISPEEFDDHIHELAYREDQNLFLMRKASE